MNTNTKNQDKNWIRRYINLSNILIGVDASLLIALISDISIFNINTNFVINMLSIICSVTALFLFYFTIKISSTKEDIFNLDLQRRTISAGSKENFLEQYTSAVKELNNDSLSKRNVKICFWIACAFLVVSAGLTILKETEHPNSSDKINIQLINTDDSIVTKQNLE